MTDRRATLKSYIELYNTGIDNGNLIRSACKDVVYDMSMALFLDTISLIKDPSDLDLLTIYSEVVKYSSMCTNVDESLPKWCKFLVALKQKDELLDYFQDLDLLKKLYLFDSEYQTYINHEAIHIIDPYVANTYGYYFCCMLQSMYPAKYPEFETLVGLNFNPWNAFDDKIIISTALPKI